ncbi:alpha/beta fold hydrolase [Undibacterium sp.]|uniref:alpha/beta fold hydrolase n=1 Tax=Undibacterium sp. TaxID=1914977 RepID=UPI002731132F|nr:alpha/beta hydrolase [Undibacterium sp.]MDP1980317.1 alpha/beta hydrolase [Undibacterium sp.]
MTTFTDISFTSSDGLQLYARDYASRGGPAKCAVICIHGLTRNSGDFEELAPWIAEQGRRVIAVDVRGRGRSQHDADPDHYNSVVYANDVIKLARDLGIGRAVFIGTSMGGLITMTVAARKLNLIAAAILNDVGPALSAKGLGRIAGFAGKTVEVNDWDEATHYIRQVNLSAFPGNSMEEWGKWARRAFAENVDGKLALQYDSNIARPLQNGQLKSKSWVANFAFRRLARNRPTLLIRGDLSDLVEHEQLAYMKDLAPDLQYAEVSGVGHAPMLMEAQAQKAIREFLASVD